MRFAEITEKQQVAIIDRASGMTLAQGVLGDEVVQLEDSWYFPAQQVAMEALNVTERVYICPYKGKCFWIDLTVDGTHAQNIAWVYDKPKAGYERIAGLIGFNKFGSTATTPQVG
jgi:uncharacterized protein (DUF427 family)